MRQPRPLSLSSSSKRQLHLQQQITCSAGVAHPGEEREGSSDLLSLSVPTTSLGTSMKGGLGSRGGGATLEKSKLDLSKEVQTAQPRLDNDGGGGNIGKGIFNGGGGDGDGGDDDDYFNEFGDGDDGDGGDGWFRKVFAELYTAEAIAAVLQEWYKTMADLPLILRQAAQMGLFSSAALVRFLSMDVRPNMTRLVTRSLPPAVSREVVGRLMADPAFMQKLVLEQMITIGTALVYEAKVRGDRFMKELDLVAINVLTLAAANAAVVYLVSPTRAAPAPGRWEWQNKLASLPNNVFESSLPQRAVSNSSRAAGFVAKAAELCGVGVLAGAAQSALAQADVAVRRRGDPSFRPSMPVPAIGTAALGMAAHLGIFGNVRYQLIAGIDDYLYKHAGHLWSYLAVSSVFRTFSTGVGEQTRRFLLGLPRPSQVAAQRYVQRQVQAVAPARPALRSSGKKKRSKRPAGFEMSYGPPSRGPQQQAMAAT